MQVREDVPTTQRRGATIGINQPRRMAGSCPTAIKLAATLFGQLPLSLAEHGIVVMN